MKKEEVCPVCNSSDYVTVNAESYQSLVVPRRGSVDVVCCTNCGVLRVTQESISFRKLKENSNHRGGGHSR